MLEYESEYEDYEWEDQLNDIHAEIEEEERLWHSQGFSPQMVQINPHVLQMKVNCLMAILERFGVSQAEMEATFKQAVVDQLRLDRAMLTEQKLKVTLPQSPLFGPNGRLL